MRKFKKKVIIGGFEGKELEGLTEALLKQAEEEDTIDELRAVLIYTLAKLTLSHPKTKATSEVCK